MENNMILFTEFMGDINASYEPFVTLHWLGKDIQVKKHLSLSDILSFVSDVISACYMSFGDDDEDGSDLDGPVYTPELKQYAIDNMTIAYYTNIDMTSGESAFDFIYHSDILDRVKELIDFEQYADIIMSINNKIEYINNSNIFEMTKDIQNVNNAMSDLYPALNAISETFDAEELSGIISTLSKIQENNSLMDLATREMKSESDKMIQFKTIVGDKNGGESKLE